MIKISVIVPIYKVEQYLEECIESIVNQTYRNIEIILVDDGSPDQCPLICDQWAKADERITVIHQENLGLSEARNAGIRIATGEYLAFIDSDDYYQDLEFLDTIHKHLLAERVDMIQYNRMENISYPVRILQCRDFQEVFVMLTDMTMYLVNAWNKVVRRDLIINNGLYFKKDMICEDFDWTYHLVFYIKTVQVMSSVPIYHRNNPTSIMNNINKKMVKDMLGSLTERVYYIQKMEDEELFQKHLMYMMGKTYLGILWMCSYLSKEEKAYFYKELYDLQWLVSCVNPKIDKYRRLIYQVVGMKGYMWLLTLKRTLRL
ncbi:MAG: glycosyltransferase family 2 protein [Eubacteriales bacterium]